MATWTRKPKECDGDYFYSGREHVTPKVKAALSPEEIAGIVADLQAFANKESGINRRQVFVDEFGREVLCIDELGKSLKESDILTSKEIEELDYWTMMFIYEY